MDERIFKIHLNPAIINRFDDALDEQEHISARKVFSGRQYNGINAWDCICSCIHRVRDTVNYLNDMELGKMSYGNAFDFMEFINNSAVVIDSIGMLAEIFSVNLEEENNRCTIFQQKGSDGKGTDKDYFEFIRALCVVHPTKTDRHKRYHGAKLVTCPFVAWTDSITKPAFNNCDLHASVYVNQANSWGNNVNIYIEQIFAYVAFRYGLLDKISKGLTRYQYETIQAFQMRPIDSRGESEDEAAYIERLKREELERFGDANVFLFDMVKDILDFEPTDDSNKDAVRRYKNAWMYALELELNALRSMSRVGVENGGLEDDATGWSLFENLWHCHSGHPKLNGFGYQLEKLHYLDGTSGSSDAGWGRLKLFEMEAILSEYVTLDSSLADMELYYLALAALYEMALEVPCRINEAIPVSQEYRRCPDAIGEDSDV